MNCSLDFLHYATREADSRIDFHVHQGFELVYYVNGSGTTHIGKTKYEYGANHFTVIQPGYKHDEYRRLETEVIFVGFFYDSMPVPLNNGIYRDREDGIVLTLLERMIDEMGGKSSYYDIQLNCLLMQTIVEVARIANQTSDQGQDDKIVYAKKYIEQYFSEKIDLPGLAEIVGYSYDHFRHLFKASTGYSPMQFVVAKRIDKAKQMLLQSKKPITSISMECGFSNSPQFCMMFKKHVGLSPKQYRNAMLTRIIPLF